MNKKKKKHITLAPDDVLFSLCTCKGNISPASEILTCGFKSERKLFIKKIDMRRFIKRLYQSRAD